MDPQRLKEAYQRLEALDERLTFKIRPSQSMVQPTPDQLNKKYADLSNYTLELKDIMREFMLAFARRPSS
ncbi:MAG: hypothetical protein AAGN66_03915 [Acidobacteriota bacterium]